MTEVEYEVLKRKREICKPNLSITDSDAAHKLQNLIAKKSPEWTYVVGRSLSDGWGSRNEPVAEEAFTVQFDVKLQNHRHCLLSAYRDGIDVEVQSDPDCAGEDQVVISVWQGDSFDGHRKYKKFEFVLRGPWWTIEGFQARIESKWTQYTQDCVENEEFARLARRRKEVSDALLAGTYEVNSEDDDE